MATREELFEAVTATLLKLTEEIGNDDYPAEFRESLASAARQLAEATAWASAPAQPH